MVIISVSDVSLSFGATPILSSVSFSVNEGDRLGVIGTNGAGKTSLFRILVGEYTPDSGSIFLAKGKTVGLLRQDTVIAASEGSHTLLSYMFEAFPACLAIEREIKEIEESLVSASPEEVPSLSSRLAALHTRYQQLGGLEFRARSRSTLLRLGFPEQEHDRAVSSLSGGQHTRLALARLLASEPDILMLDEPTNHLDIDALVWLETFLAEYKKTVLVISHDRYFLDRVTNKTLQISRTAARLYPGNYTKCKRLQAEEAAANDKRYKEQEKIRARIERNIQFQRECGREHNFVTIRSKEKQLERMEKLEKTAPPEKAMTFRFSEAESTANEVLTAKNLSFSYGTAPLLTNLSFQIRKGERVFFLGRNGCGKSTLMRLLFGALSPTHGSLLRGYNLAVGYYDQETRFISDTHTVMEELETAYPSKTNYELRSVLARFLFYAEDTEKRIFELSGGERARLALAKLILKKVNLLIMDEPTNHLDIPSREVLEETLSAFTGTVVAVSHDRYFVDALATRLLVLDPSQETGVRSISVGEGESAYSAYLESASLSAGTHAVKTAPTDEKQRYLEEKERERLRRKDERRRKKAEERIKTVEARIAEIDRELYGDAATDYVRAAALSEEKDRAEEELLTLYELVME